MTNINTALPNPSNAIREECINYLNNNALKIVIINDIYFCWQNSKNVILNFLDLF